MRAIYMAAVDPDRALSDEALADSLAATLAQNPAGSGWWVFAYGSLLWNPLFPFADARPASLHGLHRHFCLWSMGSRGTVKVPGLVLGLDRGGSCHGVAYRLPARCAERSNSGIVATRNGCRLVPPRWLQVQSSGHSLTALAFVATVRISNMRGVWRSRGRLKFWAAAEGVFGSSADYLESAHASRWSPWHCRPIWKGSRWRSRACAERSWQHHGPVSA